MTPEQLEQLRLDLSEYVKEIIAKLDEIRCGIIDVETEVKWFHEKDR